MADTATAPSGEPPAPTMGPVQLVMYRRLRTIQKRLQKIENAEKKRADGGEIDEQQEELIAGKPQTLIMLDEFTRLTEQVTAAVHEERAAAVAEHKQKEAAKAEKTAAKRAAREPAPAPAPAVPPAPAPADAKGGKKPRGGRGGRGRRTEESTEPSSDPSADAPSRARRAETDPTPIVARAVVEETARRILSLLYFARVFDLSLPDVPPFSHELERRAALSYHSDPTRPVTPADLDFVCALARALTDRPSGPDLPSHGEAIEACVARAVRWVTSHGGDAAGADETIPGTPGVPFDRVRVVVERVAASPFNTLRPVMIGAPAAENREGNRADATEGGKPPRAPPTPNARGAVDERDEGRVPPAPAAVEGERRDDPSIPPGMGGVGFFEMLQRQQAQQRQMQHQMQHQHPQPQMQMQPQPQMQMQPPPPQFGQFAPAPAPLLGDDFGGGFGLAPGASPGAASNDGDDPTPADGAVAEGEKPRSRGARGGKKTRGGGGGGGGTGGTGGTGAGAGGRAPKSNAPGASGEERRGRAAGAGRDNGGRGGGRGGRGASGKRD